MKNINVIEEKANPLFKRKEVKFTIDAEITPSHADTRKFISEKFSTPEENIRVKNILGKFGSKNFTISAHIYESEKDKLDTEGESKKDAVAQPEQPVEQVPAETQEASTQSEQEVAAKSAPVENPEEQPVKASEASTPSTSIPKPQESKESSNKPTESNEPASEQIKEPKPKEKTE